ncbi:MAG: vitamin B12 dependent methionine synthase [Deltaproteobacteria bacterium]|nr:vitamin B12 dependent methionine synthase [Deltaproteobacteria bacterium]
METLDGIPVLITLEEVKAKLKKGDWDRVQRLLDQDVSLLQPKAAYTVSAVTDRHDHAVKLNGTLLKSRVLGHHLKEGMRVFPFLITIGNGLQNRADRSEDLPDKFYLDTIGNLALTEAREYLKNHLKNRFKVKRLSHLSPGSLPDWPIEEQQPLFSLLNGAERAIDVQLTPQLLMIPTKSVSGIFFPTETPFQSCQLCPRDRCPGRRATYSQELVATYGLKQKG